MRKLLLSLILLPCLIYGQSRIGEWKAHVSFTPVIKIAETSESIVAATANGLLFADKEGRQITATTKANGLSDDGISAISYATVPNILLIGYQNGNLDLIQKGGIVNFPDLTRKVELPNKTIHRIICEGNYAWLCCAFGIVKVDLLKVEVAETWYLGAQNDLKEANDLAFMGDNWYVATNHGILIAPKQNSNLQDYRNWKLQSGLPQPDADFSSIALSDGLLFVHDRSNDQLLAWDGNKWLRYYPEIKQINGIKSAPNGLIILTKGEVWLIGKSGNKIVSSYQSGGITEGIDPRDALTDSNGKLWIGDNRFGLTGQTTASDFIHIESNSPESDQITALNSANEEIFAATSTYNTVGNPEASISIYQAGIWQNFSAADDAGLKSIRPITAFAFSISHPDEYWASTAGSGLLYFQKNRVTAHYNELNSSLGALNSSCVVNSLAADNQNNLFYTNPTGKVPLGSLSQSGNFVSLPYPGLNFSNITAGNQIISKTGVHWVVLPQEGLFAFKVKGSIENITDDQFRKVAVQSRFSNGTISLITSFGEISTIVEDHSQDLWVGTGAGVVVYTNPDRIFDSGEFYGAQPSLDDGEGLFKPILEKEKITAVAVDGGNRKWVGTANSGAFLFSEQGNHLLRHFDGQNSPLPSGRIDAIAIVPGSGEVFFATERGLFSWKSDAIEGAAGLEKAYVWPNPLRETFDGVATIDGLTEGTEIKVTDVTGNLIFKTSSLGGRATWNVKNSNGKRVATGVYLIFCNSPQQKITKIIKLLIIH
ncbi:MAG: T9SS type A sorting domain-containing protein [Bacteroidia bacterium]|nr:T9SS type A sorting domain-containing protein [Bacteroidia bacterium]